MLNDEGLGMISWRARQHGERTAIICGDQRLSFVEVDDRVARLAGVLQQLGLGPGRVASIYGPIGWEWVVAYHAAVRIGAIVNPINALLTPDEVAFILKDCQAHTLLTDSARLDALAAAGGLPSEICTIKLDLVPELSSRGTGIAEPLPSDPASLSTICYTSGTTGRPKGAMLSHRSVAMNAGLTALMHGRNASDIVVTGLPLAHVYGNVIMNSSLIVGATMVLLPTFDPKSAIEAIVEHKATRFEGVPTMYYRLLEAPEAKQADLSSLRMCTVGGQTMPVDKMEAVERTFGCPLIELWGMSEIGGLGTTFPWTGPRALGSIGIALPGVTIRTVDPETRQPCRADEPGELQIRGTIVMDGYLGNPTATKETIDSEGWLSTGDIARIDEAGQAFVVDRLKDVILTSGNNVYPAEIERVISACPGVVMVGVGRDAHPDKGEVPHAYVVAEAGSNLTEQAVSDHCRAFLAPYKLPRAVTFVDDLPKTSSGKIMRRNLGK